MINEIYYDDDGGGAIDIHAAAIYITLLIYFSIIRAVVFYTVVSVAIEHLHLYRN